ALFLSATFAFASNSKPGDKLFALNKLGEDIVLKLPLSVEQQANVQAYIVSNRLQALDQVISKPEETLASSTKKLQTIKETDDSLSKAVEAVTKNQAASEASGRTQSAVKL